MTEASLSLRDLPLLVGVAVATYVLLIAFAQVLNRIRGVRFGGTYHLFALAAGLLAGVHASPWQAAGREVAIRHLTAATVVLGAFPVMTLLNRALWLTRDKQGSVVEAPRVLADLTGVILVTLAVLATLQFIYGVQVPGLLAGSGVAALILGLGMQDQLHNLFAGVSLHMSKPFKTGDWLLIDGQHAKVIGLSWRATRLLTSDDVMIEIGNSELLKQTVTNFNEPQRRHAVRATIGLDCNAPPARVQQLLREAATSVPDVCSEPEPQVYLKDFGDCAIVYEIKVWIDDHAAMSRVLSDVRAHCWYAVNRAGIDIPYPQLIVHRGKTTDPGAAARDAARRALRGHALFNFLSAEQLEQLLRESAVVTFAPTEHLIRQDDPGDSLFFLVRGRVEVQIKRSDRTVAVAKLGPGDCFGEMSLLAGEPRSATVVSLTEVEAVELPKPAFASLVRDYPDVIGRLTELLAQRQLANAQQAANDSPLKTADQARRRIGAKLRAFFELGA